MKLIVSDTNVFIALHKCGLLFKVFSNQYIELIIPQEIYEELTHSSHRVSREYPNLSDLIQEIVHNPNHGRSILLKVSNLRYDLTDTIALAVYYQLEKDAFLDKGEREAIPLAIQLSAVFITCESDAISEFNDLPLKNNSTAFQFEPYCEDLYRKSAITKDELSKIRDAIHN